MENKRKCPVCGETITGRPDKKFCSDQCRAEFNNRNNKDSTNAMRKINRILRRNRRILAELNPDGKTRISRQKLAEMGFDFQYFTNLRYTRRGKTCYFCYEQGYFREWNGSCILIVNKQLYG
jgi:predicted nucleic acid-binding Zn ribbon protein